MLVYIILFLKKIMFHIIICVLRLWPFIFSSLNCCCFSLFCYHVGQNGTLIKLSLACILQSKLYKEKKNCWLCAMKRGEGNISSNFYSIAPPFLVSFLELALTKIHISTRYFLFFIKLLIFSPLFPPLAFLGKRDQFFQSSVVPPMQSIWGKWSRSTDLRCDSQAVIFLVKSNIGYACDCPATKIRALSLIAYGARSCEFVKDWGTSWNGVSCFLTTLKWQTNSTSF